MDSIPVESCLLWPPLTSDIWQEDRCQRGRQWGTEVIGRVPLGDAEAEYIFELLPWSRVTPEVIECGCAQRKTMTTHSPGEPTGGR